jgi:hypothetical protein
VFLQVKNAGADTQTQALVTGPVQTTVTTSTFNGQNYNYIQFRTAGGGLHAGWMAFDSLGNLSGEVYRPSVELTKLATGSGNPFKLATADGAVNLGTGAVANGYLVVTQGSKTNYVFGVQNGLFVMDSPKGTSLALPKASSASFNSSFAGTYNLLSYSKTVTAVDVNGVETGTPSLSSGTIVLDSAGNITYKDSNGTTVFTGALQPISTASLPASGGLYSAGLGDPCNGLFTVRVPNAGNTGKWDIYIGFLPGSTGTPNVAFVAAFFTLNSATTDQNYNYVYGVGVAH